MMTQIMKMCIFVLCILIFHFKNSLSIPVSENTLQQVHVVFRHGDRTPDKTAMYPKDPHINDTWFPDGLGALTILGKKQEYQLGQSLRKRYNKFLGDLYLPELQIARSTGLPRAKISLQLVLAGLWPPNKQQIIDKDLPWQPTEFNYENFARDELLGHPLFLGCKNYLNEYLRVGRSNKVQDYFKQNKDKIDYINSNSGLHINTTMQLMILYFVLYTEEHTNRKLPSWTKTVYPEFLEDAAKRNYFLTTATNFMIQATGGRLVKKILDDVKSKIKGKSRYDKTKIILYSGHETNIAYTLIALNSFKPHVPAYASHIIFELHKIDQKYGFMIFHQDKPEDKLELLKIPGCEEFCPIDKFEKLRQEIMPGPNFKC